MITNLTTGAYLSDSRVTNISKQQSVSVLPHHYTAGPEALCFSLVRPSIGAWPTGGILLSAYRRLLVSVSRRLDRTRLATSCAKEKLSSKARSFTCKMAPKTGWHR